MINGLEAKLAEDGEGASATTTSGAVNEVRGLFIQLLQGDLEIR